jgi:hypothetical protein
MIWKKKPGAMHEKARIDSLQEYMDTRHYTIQEKWRVQCICNALVPRCIELSRD